MSFFSGAFSSENNNPPELNTRSFAGSMLRRFPNGSFPLWGLLSQQPKSTAKATMHGYFSKTMVFGGVQTNVGNLLSTDTSLTFDTTSGILVDMVLYNPRTRENVRVTAVTSGTVLAVSRAYGRVAAAAILDNDTWLVIGTSYAQGSARPTSLGLTTVYIPNYTQIFRNAWAMTDTARASYAEAGFSNIAENKRDCSMMHSVHAESTIFFGQAKMDTTGSQPRTSTQGIYDAVDQYAPANTNTAGATTSYNDLVTLMEPAFLYSTDMGNPRERVAFVGATALKTLNAIGRASGVVTITQDENSFGMQFTSFKFYKGTIRLIEHPLFNAWPDLAKLMVVVELAALKLAYLNGRDTKPEEYGGDGKNNANGADAIGGSLTTEFAVELINPYACCVVENLTAAIG